MPPEATGLPFSVGVGTAETEIWTVSAEKVIAPLYLL